MEDTIRVLIADDHPHFREGMRGRLDRVADIEVVGEAASGDEVVDLAHKLKPEVILMDIKMPGLGGIEATRKVLRASSRVHVLVLTMFEDEDSVFAAIYSTVVIFSWALLPALVEAKFFYSWYPMTASSCFICNREGNALRAASRSRHARGFCSWAIRPMRREPRTIAAVRRVRRAS